MANLLVQLIVKYLVIIILLVLAFDFVMYKMKSKFRLSRWFGRKAKKSASWTAHLPLQGVKSLWGRIRNKNKKVKK